MKIKTINVETVQLSCLLAGDEVAALSESVLENYKTVIAQTRTAFHAQYFSQTATESD